MSVQMSMVANTLHTENQLTDASFQENKKKKKSEEGQFLIIRKRVPCSLSSKLYILVHTQVLIF